MQPDSMHVVDTGVSSGVGSATMQLTKRRGACGHGDHFARQNDPAAGTRFDDRLKLLKCGDCLVLSGVIAGPMVEFDLCTPYLNNLSVLSCTTWEEEVFPNLIGYIEHNEFQPITSQAFPRQDIVQAQREFLRKQHRGKLTLIPWSSSPQ